LAIGTARGNLTVYNHMTSKRVPVLGKHTRKITTCAWSQNNMLAVGSEDKTMSISNALGDTIRVTALRAEPSDIQFSDMKLDERSGKDNTVSVVVGQKTLFLYNLQDPNNPIELAFQARYGSILAYKWFGDGYILLGFSEGYFVQISTHIKEVGQELFQCKNHKDFLSDIAYSTVLGKVASCGDNKVKIHDVANLTEVETVITIEDDP
ncbi:WD repeat-containing protein 19-like, partial [Diaphorina citri]|uniref:WD repeat-containing protein 19-like n=1 Tax=Diaphorina citri TaxID=121845 RepID=A0A1S4ERG3_DIACI